MNEVETFIFYIIISLLSIILLKIATKREKRDIVYYISTISSFLVLTVVNVIRGSQVGSDYINVGNRYTEIVNGISNNSEYQWFGTGLNIFCIVIGKIFGDSPFIFYFFIGMLTMVFLYRFLLNSCKYPTISLAIYLVFCLYLQSFNQSRQILAVVIILFATKYIEQKNFIKYICFVLIASIFHESALIFLPLYFLFNKDINKKMFITYLIAFIIIFYGDGIIIELISHTKYEIYLSTIYNRSFEKSAILNTFVRIAMITFCLLNIDKEEKDNKIYNFSIHMVIICTILQLLTLKYYFIGRLTTYFYAFYLIVLPITINRFIKRFKVNCQSLVCIFIILVMCIYYYTYYNSKSGAIGSGYSKYYTIFEEVN